MKRLAMHNGTVVDHNAIKLRCTSCEAFRDYTDGPQSGVYCVECGQRHASDSLVDTSAAGVEQ
jgi:hypothetical protein